MTTLAGTEGDRGTWWEAKWKGSSQNEFSMKNSTGKKVIDACTGQRVTLVTDPPSHPAPHQIYPPTRGPRLTVF